MGEITQAIDKFIRSPQSKIADDNIKKLIIRNPKKEMEELCSVIKIITIFKFAIITDKQKIN